MVGSAMPSQTFQAHCSCGRVVLEGIGAPIASCACYCDDCQAAGKQIDAMPGGHSGLLADGGTVSVLFRKDRLNRARGSELLVEHQLHPSSHAKRLIASCCNSNMATTFDNWFPMTALRTHSVNAGTVRPQMCIQTKYAPDASRILHDAPRSTGVPGGLVLKMLGAVAALALKRVPLADGRMS
jgi:hypothetical protein